MTTEQQLNAKHLYFQTDMSKTQIASLLNIPRRTFHYWIREKNWDRLKKSATHMPSLLAEKCYHLIAQFTDQLLSENRIMKPITSKEADTLHKLTITVNKLKNRATLNESVEMFGFFMERVNQKSPELAQAVSPIVEECISSRANAYITDFRPENFNDFGLIPTEKPDLTEAQLDLQDITAWTDAGKPVMDIEQLRSMPEPNVSVQPTGSSIDSNRAQAADNLNVTDPATSEVNPDYVTSPALSEASPDYVTSPAPSERAGERSLAQDTPVSVTSPAPLERAGERSLAQDTPDYVTSPAPSERAGERSLAQDTPVSVTSPSPSERAGERSLAQDTPVSVTSPAPLERAGERSSAQDTPDYVTSPSPSERAGERSPTTITDDDQPATSKYTLEQIEQILREATPPKDPSIGLSGKINPDTFYARMPKPRTMEERRAYKLAEQAMYDAIYGPELIEKDSPKGHVSEAA